MLVLMGVFVVTGLLMTAMFLRRYRFLTFLSNNGSGLFQVTNTPSNSDALNKLIAAIRSNEFTSAELKARQNPE